MNVDRRIFLSGATFLSVSNVAAAAKNKQINDLQLAIDKAVETTGLLHLPAGTFATAGLKVNGTLQIIGVAGHTKLVSLAGAPILTIGETSNVSINGLTFIGKDVPHTEELSATALVTAKNAMSLLIERCNFSKSSYSGLRLEGCSGRIVGNEFERLGEVGIVAIDSAGLEISSNVVNEIGNNGIQVFRSEVGADGTRILNNQISNINNISGGSGQYGNGINVFRAGNVLTSGNSILNAAYSGIRYNSASNAQILGNSISKTGETALYVEFTYEGAVVANNVIDDVAQGISIVNFDVGGRLATCTGNIVRNVKTAGRVAGTSGHGIVAEADSLIANNIVEDIETVGIWLGWGGKCRNLSAQGNIVRNCQRGITVSVTAGAGQIVVAGNVINDSREFAIVGMDYKNVATAELGKAGTEVPANLLLSNNVVTP